MFKTFPPEIFAPTVDMAANQGVYNAFLAVGLVWSLLIKEEHWQFKVAVCFLSFVALAGVAAAVTTATRTGLPQLVPASVALALLILSRRKTESS